MSEEGAPPPAEGAPPPAATPTFLESLPEDMRIDPAITGSGITDAAGLAFSPLQPADHRSGPMSGGGAIGDFNGDGYADIFVLGGGEEADALFINNRDGSFTNRAPGWGIARQHRGVGATVADYDHDGDNDIFVTSLGSSSEPATFG